MPRTKSKALKVRVSYIEYVDDDLRERMNRYYGQPGKASRQEIKDWFWLHGQTLNEEI